MSQFARPEIGRRTVLVAMLIAAVWIPSETAVAAEYLIPPSIDPTCTNDVHAELQAWLATVPDSSTVKFPVGACYRVESELAVVDRTGLIFQGQGATLRQITTLDLTQNTGNAAILGFLRGGGHQVLDLNLRGSHPDTDTFSANAAHRPGIRVRATQGLTLNRVDVSFTWGDWVELKGETSGDNQPSRNVTIKNSVFNRSGRQGIYLAGVETAMIEKNSLTNANFSTFDQEAVSDVSVARFVTIRDNDVYGPDTAKFVTSTHPTPITEDWRILDNRLHSVALEIVFYRSAATPITNVTIMGNTSDTAGGVAVRLFAVHSAVVRNNDALFRSDKDAVELQSVDGVTVKDNLFRRAVRLLAVDRGVWDGKPYVGPASVNYSTCGNRLTADGMGDPIDGLCP